MADSIEAFLNRLHHPMLAGIDLSLDRMHRLLGLLGSPHKRLPPVIHVAGTNGKGSLLAYLQAIFERAGYRVHRYTSPHLVHFRERIVLAGKEIDNGYLETILKHVAPVLQAQPATFFEATTAAAFLAFSDRPADVLLLETGLGGRLDATNVIDKPLLTAITPIAFDHCEYLGNTIEAIAAEKAGIIKHGVACVVGRQDEKAIRVIEQKANALNAPLSRFGQEWQTEGEGGQAYYQSSARRLPLAPSLAGRHQCDNAATAIACIEQLPRFAVSDAQITQGLGHAIWPGRLQPLPGHPYRQLLLPGIELWLDGGHNPQGGEVLAAWCAEQEGKELHLICGMVSSKDTRGYLKPLAAHATALYAITIPNETHSQTAAQLAAAAKDAGIAAHVASSVENALQTIAQRAKTPAIACICGSLYLAGNVLAAS